MPVLGAGGHTFRRMENFSLGGFLSALTDLRRCGGVYFPLRRGFIIGTKNESYEWWGGFSSCEGPPYIFWYILFGK